MYEIEIKPRHDKDLRAIVISSEHAGVDVIHRSNSMQMMESMRAHLVQIRDVNELRGYLLDNTDLDADGIDMVCTAHDAWFIQPKPKSAEDSFDKLQEGVQDFISNIREADKMDFQGATFFCVEQNWFENSVTTLEKLIEELQL